MTWIRGGLPQPCFITSRPAAAHDLDDRDAFRTLQHGLGFLPEFIAVNSSRLSLPNGFTSGFENRNSLRGVDLS